MEKTSEEFIRDVLDGRVHKDTKILDSAAMATFQSSLESEYDLSDESLQRALCNHRQEIESAIGVPLTDESLVALSGGKKLTAEGRQAVREDKAYGLLVLAILK